MSPWLRRCSGRGDQIAGHVVTDVLHPEVARGLRVLAVRGILVPRLATVVTVADLLVLATTLAIDRKFRVRIEQEDLLATVRATGRLPTIEVLVGQLLAELVELLLFLRGCDLLVQLIALGRLDGSDLLLVACDPVLNGEDAAAVGDLGRENASRVLGGLLSGLAFGRPGIARQLQLRLEDTEVSSISKCNTSSKIEAYELQAFKYSGT